MLSQPAWWVPYSYMVKRGDQYVTLYGSEPTRFCTEQINASKWNMRSNAEFIAAQVFGRVVRLKNKPWNKEEKTR